MTYLTCLKLHVLTVGLVCQVTHDTSALHVVILYAAGIGGSEMIHYRVNMKSCSHLLISVKLYFGFISQGVHLTKLKLKLLIEECLVRTHYFHETRIMTKTMFCVYNIS